MILVVYSSLILLEVLHRVEAHVYIIYILHIDVAQLFDVCDILDDLSRYHCVGVELSLELDLGSLLLRYGELQLALFQIILGCLFALSRCLSLKRLFASELYLFFACGVYLLHIAVGIFRGLYGRRVCISGLGGVMIGSFGLHRFGVFLLGLVLSLILIFFPTE